MNRTIAASLALTFAASMLASPVLAQSDGLLSPSPLTEASPSVSEEAQPDSLMMPAFGDPAWRDITPARGPAGREDHTWTVDAAGRFAYLFGGRDGEREFADLWRYDLQQDRWRKLAPQGKRPQPRFGHSAVWVDGLGVVVFAGQRGTSFFDDLWSYDPDAERWAKLPGKGAVPKSRYGSCMVVGPDGRLWISHGFTRAGRFDDTRAYNLKTRRWASLGPDGRRPGERCLHDCFTSARGELVLYGGQDDGAFALGDLWVMDRERRWVPQPDPRPAPRRLYAVTEEGDHAFIFGGAGEDNGKFDDLWRVDRETLEFERVSVDGAAPAARYGGALITDRERGRLLLFGGQDSEARADVWELVDRTPLASGEAVPEPAPSQAP